MDFRAKHLEGVVEAHEEIDQTFAIIAAAGGPTMAELQAMPMSQSADLRAGLEDSLMEHGDIHPTDDPAAIGWTVELSQPVGDAHTLFMREPLGRDLKTPGRTSYQHNRNLLLNLLTIPDKQPGRLKPADIDNMAVGDFLNMVRHIARVIGPDYQGF